jgi:phospholipase C
LKYKDGATEREMTVPAGDVFFQFRKDVNSGQLPAVSWLAGPQNFSDHPSAPWFGAWYVSEIMDILTKNPEVWKKTIFIVTYDENDGYFDHVVPFSIPDNNKPETGKCSDGIETEIEFVRLANELKQGIPAKQAREAPVGLGFRVPMIIALPWTRGGRVCSQVFDHTSTLQFLESFFSKKLNKEIKHENIGKWRRTICGDLSAVFNSYDTRKAEAMPFLNRDRFVEDIHNAKFKEPPSGYKKLSAEELNKGIQSPSVYNPMAEQEKGIVPSCGLPYELYADGKWDTNSKSFAIEMRAGKEVFGNRSAGSPFTVCAPGNFTDNKGSAERSRNWSFAVIAGDAVRYNWPGKAFDNGQYHLRLYGPNGFYREFLGGNNDPSPTITIEYEKDRNSNKPSGNVLLRVNNTGGQKSFTVNIVDNAYKASPIVKEISTNNNSSIIIKLNKSFGWYDFTVKIKGFDNFEKRYAGRVETGKESFSDPFMGRVI